MNAYLIRHTEPAVRGVCYGRLDVPLSAAGLAHARRIADGLAGEPIAAVYTSPLQRCSVLAAMLASQRPLTVLDSLRELDFGDFEGRTFDELARDSPAVYRQWMETPLEVRFPNGESFADLRARVLTAARAIRERHAGETVAIVSHGGPIRILLADDPFAIDLPYGAIRRAALP
jgi:alpha-ribazole phosphatase/probable phosphoglycerate mutase